MQNLHQFGKRREASKIKGHSTFGSPAAHHDGAIAFQIGARLAFRYETICLKSLKVRKSDSKKSPPSGGL